MNKGKIPAKFNYDPQRPQTAVDFELKISAIVSRYQSGYMDSQVVVKNYKIGSKLTKDFVNLSMFVNLEIFANLTTFLSIWAEIFDNFGNP